MDSATQTACACNSGVAVSSDATCVVCLEPLGVPEFQPHAAGDGAQATVSVCGAHATYTLPCGHTLHVVCAVNILVDKQQCPVCRAHWRGLRLWVRDTQVVADMNDAPVEEPSRQEVRVEPSVWRQHELSGAARSRHPLQSNGVIRLSTGQVLYGEEAEPSGQSAQPPPNIDHVFVAELPAAVHQSADAVLRLDNVRFGPSGQDNERILYLTAVQARAVHLLNGGSPLYTIRYAQRAVRVRIKYRDDPPTVPGPQCLTLTPGGWWPSVWQHAWGRVSIAVSFDGGGSIWVRAVSSNSAALCRQLQDAAERAPRMHNIVAFFTPPPLISHALDRRHPRARERVLADRDAVLVLDNVLLDIPRPYCELTLILSSEQYEAVAAINPEPCRRLCRVLVHVEYAQTRDRCVVWDGDNSWRCVQEEEVHGCDRMQSVALSFNEEDGIVLRAFSVQAGRTRLLDALGRATLPRDFRDDSF